MKAAIGSRGANVSGLRKLDVKQLFCLCGFAFLGFFLWVSLVPVTAAPVNPMVSQAMRIRSVRAHLTQLREQKYQMTGDWAQAVLAVEPDVNTLQDLMHQTTDSWTILSNDPELRRSAQTFQVSLAVMQEQARIVEDEVLVARMMQQVGPERREKLLKSVLLPLIDEEQISRERFQEFASRPGI